jgi:iron complex outermembrane receptor protein
VQITGGNPDLQPQTTKITRVGGILRLVPRLNLQLNAEYTDTNRLNFLSSLPSASADVMLAFPDRYIRDANGTLITMDLRPVNFDADHEKRLRWGFSMSTKLGSSAPRGSPPPRSASGAPIRRPGPSTFVQLTVNHTMVFYDKIFIRPGLDPVDLLKGGAIGIGGGRLRHQVDGTASVTSGGLGARMGVTWRGPSLLETRIGTTSDTLHFSPVMLINLRLFADAGRVIPHEKWVKGMRLSLDVINLTNKRQSVRDSFGDTPLQYQPGYRDPLGRTIEIEFRKVF